MANTHEYVASIKTTPIMSCNIRITSVTSIHVSICFHHSQVSQVICLASVATRCVTFCSNSQRLAGPILLKGSTSARFTKPRATNLRQARMEGPGEKWGGREAGLCYVSHMETHQAVQFACKSVKIVKQKRPQELHKWSCAPEGTHGSPVPHFGTAA